MEMDMLMMVAYYSEEKNNVRTGNLKLQVKMVSGTYCVAQRITFVLKGTA